MDDYMIFTRLVSLYDKQIADDDFRDTFLLAIQDGINNKKITTETLIEVEKMKADEIVDYVNGQLRLF